LNLIAAGNIYVADNSNQRIEKFDSDGVFLTTWGTPGTGDGQFDDPFGLAFDSSGNIYVADMKNNRIQRFGGPWLELLIGESELPTGR
jgi:DNA-binding beta-propeller fold protein YncE